MTTFKLKTKVSGWKAALAAIMSQANEDAIFEIRQEGLMFKARDPSKVSLVAFLWNKENFSTFEFGEAADNTKLGFKVKDWLAVFKRFDKDADVILSYQGEGAVTIQSENKEFSAFLMHPEYLADVSKIPDKLKESFDIKVETTIKVLQDVIEDIRVFSNGVTFEIDNNTLTFTGGGESGKSKVRYPLAVAGDKTKGRYQNEYLSSIVNDMAPYCEALILEIKQDYPLSLVLAVPDIGKMQFYVAPMVETA